VTEAAARGRIILLNGVSSSGKTTLARSLAGALPGFFPLCLDAFDDLVASMEDRQGGRLIPVATERFFHRTLLMFSDSGVSLVADHILHDEATRSDFYETLRGREVLLVGLRCPLEEAERRERERGDRPLGLARRQAAFVHRDEAYDLEMDTSRESVEACVERIRARALGPWRRL